MQPTLRLSYPLLKPLKVRHLAVRLPKEPPLVSSTPLEDIDKAVLSLREKADAWQRLSCTERSLLLEQCIDVLPSVARDAAAAAADAHGSYGSGIGEEHLFWVPILMGLIDYKDAMDAEGCPRPVEIYKRGDRYVADVFPKGAASLLFGGCKTEVWIQKGAAPTQGRIYRDKASENAQPAGRVALVLGPDKNQSLSKRVTFLGAGNHLNVVLLDTLHKLLVDDDVVIVKMNPQNAFLGVYVQRALAPFFDQGFVKMVYGDVTEGQYLCRHPEIDNIHLTGSIITFNQIVFGEQTPTEKSKPLIEKPTTAELGCVTPMIIVPDDWSESDMDYAAMCIVEGLASNSAHSCCALQVIVMSEGWSKRTAFLEILKQKFNKREQQVAWYKGSDKRYENFRRQFPSASSLGRSTHQDDTVSPWLFAMGLTPEQANTKDENWCGVLQEVMLPGNAEDGRQFLEQAVKFCNDRCWGSLACSVIIHPTTIREYPEALNDAIEKLRYGNIVVNAPPFIGFLPAGSWGAYPGNPIWNVGSGNMFNHNTSLFDHPEKSVSYVPWRSAPVPYWADISNKETIIESAMQFLKSPGVMTAMTSVVSIMRASE